MDWWTHFEPWLTQATPLLPSLALVRVARHLSWAVVLLFALLWFTRGWLPRWQWLRRGLALALLGLVLLPDPWSLAFWLGLAFQMPSLSSVLLCGAGLWACWRPTVPGVATLSSRRLAPATWRHAALAGGVLGWLLLLDTFALLPFSLYAWGFAPVTLGVLALLGLMPALLRAQYALSGLWLGVLLLHLVLRLPTGNAWDAVLDPALWLWLQVAALRRLRRG